MNKAKKKVLFVPMVLAVSFIVIIFVMYGGKGTSKAGIVEKPYARFTNEISGKTLEVSKKSAYGKVASKGGKIGFWYFENQAAYDANTPMKKGYIKFDKDGKWQYSFYDNNPVADKTEGVGSFDLQSVFEINKQGGLLNVKFFEGDYTIYNFYRLYSNTYVYGLGQNITKLHKSNNSPVFLTFDDSSKNVKGYNGTKNIRLRAFTVDCYSKDIDEMFNASLLFAAHTQNITVLDVGVINGYATHAIQLASVYNVSIKKCLFKNLDYLNTSAGYERMTYSYCVKNGLVERNEAFNKEVIQIESDTVGTSDSGVVYSLPTAKLSRDDTPSKKIAIQDNAFKRVVCAIGNHSTRSAKYQENIVIVNNTFDTTVGDTLRLAKYKNTRISGNKFAAVSSSYVMGQRIRAVACANNVGVLLANQKNATLMKWANENYYLSSDGNYYLISRYKNSDNYKMIIK